MVKIETSSVEGKDGTSKGIGFKDFEFMKNLDVKSLDLKGLLLTEKRLSTFFASAIGRIKQSPFWNKKIVKGFWDKLSEKDKEALYKGGKMTFSKTLKSGNPISMPFFDLFAGLKYDSVKMKMFGEKFAPSVRYFVQADLLSRPGSVTSKQIEKDIAGDEKFVKGLLTVLTWIVYALAPEAIPEVRQIKEIVSKLNSVKAAIAKKGRKKRRLDECF
ncbi:hypothetical protein COY05_04565 [Candidatus Peregrinibacteria bacterium CG_4_10_14_0_2_um_filter_38_24]|nr:MAG: hypothetical protein COY05_04565 [Candidatus Peregrinibacteria bacterium CG_4_10_14_0_2_um_filter_38_24]PJC38573.1 MAG: hypothetical protein CO044_04310 [Candidatus Peregrinibacteria bacterium CG_4_9_14_0_2_um_filter_38_9]